MLHKLKNRNQEGFTIIEVLIVLAIAGLIILIVLLAVPNLQRNSRNTAMKNDVAAIAGGVAEFAANNDGALPDAASSSQTGADLTLNNATAGSAKTVAKIQAGDTYRDADGITGTITGAAGTIDVRFKASCEGATTAGTLTAPTMTLTAAASRTTAIIYTNEVKGGLQIKCTEG